MGGCCLTSLFGFKPSKIRYSTFTIKSRVQQVLGIYNMCKSQAQLKCTEIFMEAEMY